MKLFFIKSFILSSIVIFVLSLIWILTIRDNNSYLAVTLDKQKRLADLPSKRIIFVGGSNLAFGLESKKIQEASGLNVVNMGVQGGLGLSYMLNEAKHGIKKDDIVIISLAYHIKADCELKLATLLLDVNPKSIRFFDLSMTDYIALFFINLQRCLSKIFYKVTTTPTIDNKPLIYTRDAFSPEGDILSHLNQANSSTNLAGAEVMLPTKCSKEIEKINDFVTAVKERGGRVYFSYPCYPQTEFKVDSLAIANRANQFNKFLTCPILNEPKTFVFQGNQS